MFRLKSNLRSGKDAVSSLRRHNGTTKFLIGGMLLCLLPGVAIAQRSSQQATPSRGTANSNTARPNDMIPKPPATSPNAEVSPNAEPLNKTTPGSGDMIPKAPATSPNAEVSPNAEPLNKTMPGSGDMIPKPPATAPNAEVAPNTDPLNKN